jgi:glycosyltransferase involved in cell wall biosynthesis
MKILQVCKKFPYPPKDGEMIAIFNFSESFVALGHELTLLSLNTNKHYYNIKNLPQNIKNKIDFEAIDINTNINFFNALSSFIHNTPYNIDRFYSVDFDKKIIELLSKNTYDLILLEGLPLLLYINTIKKYSTAHISYRAHNVEYEIWERLSFNASNILKKKYYKLLSKQIKDFEKNNIPKVDSVVTISERDAEILKSITNIKNNYTAPACISPDNIHINSTQTNYNSLFFLGALDWLPNLEGIEWFLQDVFPLVINKMPDTKVYIAGRNTPEKIKQYSNKNIIVLGEINDISKYMNAHQIMIVPLLSGGGMRIKIIEAMLYGKAILSTSIGAEGIADENSIIRCDNATIFAEACVSMLADKNKQIELGEKAKHVASEKYTALNVTRNLLSFYNQTFNIH